MPCVADLSPATGADDRAHGWCRKSIRGYQRLQPVFLFNGGNTPTMRTVSLRQRESRAGADPRYSGGRPTTRHSSRCGSRWVSTVTWQYSVIHSITTSCSIRSFRGATTGVQFLISMSCTSSGAVSGSNHYDAYFSSCATSIFRGLLPRVRRIIVVRQAYESKKERCT